VRSKIAATSARCETDRLELPAVLGEDGDASRWGGEIEPPVEVAGDR
jgi:hypothetical protein